MPDKEKDNAGKEVAFDDLSPSEQKELLDSLPLPALPTTSESLEIRDNAENAADHEQGRPKGKGR